MLQAGTLATHSTPSAAASPAAPQQRLAIRSTVLLPQDRRVCLSRQRLEQLDSQLAWKYIVVSSFCGWSAVISAARTKQVGGRSLLRRRAARRRDTAAAVLAAWLVKPAPAEAGAAVDMFSSMLPIKEAQGLFLRVDPVLRDGVSTFLDDQVRVTYRPDAIEEAPGAEEAVIAAADGAIKALGVEPSLVQARYDELYEGLAKRVRGRAAARTFESEMTGVTLVHLSENIDSYTFRAYVRWRAYATVIGSMSGETIFRFNRSFGQRLLSSLLVDAPPPPKALNPEDVGSFVQELSKFLASLVKAGLVTRAEVDAIDDDVPMEMFAARELQVLPLSLFLQGDPLVDAQILIGEEVEARITPHPCLCALGAWLANLVEGKSRVEATFDQLYVASEFRRRSERKVSKYVPQQQLITVALRLTR